MIELEQAVRAVAIVAGSSAVTGLALAAMAWLLQDERPVRREVCGDCKTAGCTGRLHEIGAHDPGAVRR